MRVDVLNLRIIPGIPHKRNLVRVFHVESKGIHVLVDAGCPWHGRRIASWLEGKGVKPSVLVITHAHFDHYGGASQIHTQFPGLKVYAPAASHNTLALGRFLVPQSLGKTPSWARAGYCVLASKWKLGQIHPEGDGSELESLGIKIISTPGHSHDHTSLFLSDGTLLAGDAVTGPPDYTNTWCDDLQASQESIKTLAALNPTRIIPSHHPEFRGPIRLH